MQIYIYHQRNQHDNTIVRESRLIEIIVRNKQLTKKPALRESILIERSVYNRKD